MAARARAAGAAAGAAPGGRGRQGLGRQGSGQAKRTPQHRAAPAPQKAANRTGLSIDTGAVNGGRRAQHGAKGQDAGRACACVRVRRTSWLSPSWRVVPSRLSHSLTGDR